MLVKHFLIILFSFAIFSCQNQQKEEQKKAEQKAVATGGKAPVMDFMGKNVVDLGKIKEGDKIKHTFDFVNSGTAPLQITYANASCGCTVPTWPKEAVPVGGKSAIVVEFNSKNKEGKMLKNVTIYANTVPEINTVAFNIEVVNQ